MQLLQNFEVCLKKTWVCVSTISPKFLYSLNSDYFQWKLSIQIEYAFEYKYINI